MVDEEIKTPEVEKPVKKFRVLNKSALSSSGSSSGSKFRPKTVALGDINKEEYSMKGTKLPSIDEIDEAVINTPQNDLGPYTFDKDRDLKPSEISKSRKSVMKTLLEKHPEYKNVPADELGKHLDEVTSRPGLRFPSANVTGTLPPEELKERYKNKGFDYNSIINELYEGERDKKLTPEEEALKEQVQKIGKEEQSKRDIENAEHYDAFKAAEAKRKAEKVPDKVTVNVDGKDFSMPAMKNTISSHFAVGEDGKIDMSKLAMDWSDEENDAVRNHVKAQGLNLVDYIPVFEKYHMNKLLGEAKQQLGSETGLTL